MKEVRLGIVGVGNMGSIHARNIHAGKVKGARLTAVADINPAKLEALKESGINDIGFYNDVDSLINSGLTDAVIVATPHYNHPDSGIAVLESGLHLLCEKPAGVYAKQVRMLNEAAKKSNKLFTMMFNQRTNHTYRKMREMIKNGDIGTVKRVNWIITDWFRTQGYYNSGGWRATWKGEGGGVLVNQCPHQLDLLLWVTGLEPAKVRAFCHFGKWHDIEVEDDVSAYIEFDNGATGIFVTTTGDGAGTNRLEICGTKGKLVCEDNTIIFTALNESDIEFSNRHLNGFARPEKVVSQVETDGINSQHLGIIQNFTDAILGKDNLYVDGAEGIESVRLMNSMLLSQWLDKTIEFPFSDELYLQQLKIRCDSSRDKVTEDTINDLKGTY